MLFMYCMKKSNAGKPRAKLFITNIKKLTTGIRYLLYSKCRKNVLLYKISQK